MYMYVIVYNVGVEGEWFLAVIHMYMHVIVYNVG